MNLLLNSYVLSPLTITIVSFVLVGVVWRWARRNRSTLIFCGLLVSVGLWGVFTTLMRASPDVYVAAVWERILVIPAFAIYPFFYHFTISYINVRRQRGTLVTSYLLLLVLAALAPTDWIVQGMRREHYGYAANLGPLGIPLFAAGLLLLLGGAYNLLSRYRITKSYVEKNRIVYLLIAIFFPLVGALVDAFSPLPPVAIWSNLVFCIICTIAIGRYHLLDVRFVIRRSLVYLVISAMIALPYVGLLLFLTRYPQSQRELWWVDAIALMIMAIILRPLYSLAQQVVDRMFYRSRYDHLRSLHDFSQDTRSISDPAEIGKSLVRLIGRAVQASMTHLLLMSDYGDFQVVACDGDDSTPLSLAAHSILLEWLRISKNPLHRQDLDIVPQLQSLSAKDKAGLVRTKAELFIPIVTKQQELIGLLILGEKSSERPYSEEDESLLLTVASKMAVEFENSRLYASKERARRELEKEIAQKTEFLHSVAHELKTPLTAVISSSEILESEFAGDAHAEREKLRQLAQNISRSAWKMNNRVNELLELARMQSGTITVLPATLNLGPVLRETLSQFQIIFQEKDQTLLLDIPDSLPLVMADKDRVEQILTNLLSNASKFSPNDTTIAVRVRVQQESVFTIVEDSAPIIPYNERERIFEPYYRSEDDQRKRLPGLGLGLAISRKLVELQKGHIWVGGNTVRGNKFIFSLPLADAKRTAERA